MDEKAPDQDEGEAILEAEQIYVLMKKDFRLSRNTRAQWYFNHLDSVIQVSKYESIHDFSGELDVVSVVPKDPDSDWDWDIGHLYSYRVNSGSMVHFLAQRYRLVYLLDLSPSSFGSAVFPAFKKCLQALVRPFYVPGSQLLLKPDIYVTVIAWTPFLTDYSQQVLKQGFLLTSENLGSYLSSILDKLKKLGVRVSGIAASALQNIQSGRAESERIMGHLFEDEEPVEPCASIPVATPEAGFINMIRTGILALQLLPKLSSGGIIVVTDGIFSIPDMNICDSLLNQLRSSTISLSFLQVASAYHPHAGYGRVPYVELMEFFSCATYGTYLPKVPEVHHESYVYNMNIFHEAFLCWSFRKALEGLKLLTPPQVIEDRNIKRKGVLHQGVKNSLFKHSDEEFIIKKTLLEATMQCRLSSLLSVRLREGYTLNTVHILTDMIQVQLTLPWKIGTYIHYTVQCPWPQAPGPQLPLATVVVYVEGFYDTLHDIICRKDTIYSSHDRNNVTRRFYVTLQNLAHVDKLLCHIESFKTSPDHYTVPENIKKSVPLFYMPPNSTTPVFYREEFANTAFGSFWKPINFLDINIWHRWMHTNRIHIMLQHDHPLPRHLFLANSSGRYTSVHCRKAALKLFEMLKEISTFVLLENNSYVQFIKNEEDSSSNLTSHPSSFYVIRITSKPPCVVIWLAFPSGASANVRHRVHHQLLLKIDELRIRQNHLDLITPIEVKGTTLLLKPVERILVRYNKIPSDFFNLLEPAYSSGNLHHQPLLKCDGNNSTTNNNNNGKNSHPMLQQSRATSSHGTFLALARYLHHKRWIWCIRSSNFVNRNLDGEGKFLDTLISGQVLARILHTLAKSRLLEGFTFAHSHLGVQNLALELPMRHETKNVFAKKSLFTQQCVVQYVIFPPHTEFYSNVSSKNQNDSITTRNDESSSEKEDEGTSGEIQIITEVWVEPQDGVVEDGREERQYLNELKYRELPDAFFKRDKEIITTLLSFEHLVSSFEYLNYEEKEGELDNKKFMSSSTSNRDPFSTVSYIPYSPDIIQLLGKSSSVEILLSMFIQDLSDSESQHLNEKLYNKILSHIEENHDQEYPLSENEDIDFLQLILSTDSYRRKVKDSWIREDSYAKWRCFVKVFHNNHIIITLLPETYEELMNLMLIDDDDDEEEEEMTNKTPRDPNGHDKEFLDMEEEFEKKIMVDRGGVVFIKKPIEKQSIPSLLFDSSAGSSSSNLMNNNSNCDPIYSSVYTDSNYDGDCVNGRVRIRSSGSDRIKHQSSRDRAGSLEAFYGNNTDPSMRQRTFSMDSKRGCFKSSLLLRAGQNPGLSPNPLKSSTSTPKQNDEKHESKKIPPLWGSLSLPIFMYDVSTNNLITRLLKTKDSPQIVSSLIDNTFEFPEKPIKKAGFNETPLVERYIRNHAASLQSAYAKAYVHVLFESLQNHEAVHTYDVLNAVKYCDKEIFQSIDAKDFVDSICGHNDEIDEESYENNVYVDPRPCHSPNHFAIKKKFSDILGTYFQLVPGFKDLYYFYSSAEQTHYHGNRRDTIANDVDIEVASSLAKHLDSKRSCDVNPSLSFGTKSRPQNSSLGSIMTNESSNINETQDDFDGISIASNNNGCVFNPGGIDQPLFIQIFANHCKQEIQANGPPLTEIPTCWMELIGKTDEEGSYNPKDLFSIHLVAICLQPQTMCCNIPDNSMWASSVNLDFVGSPPALDIRQFVIPLKRENGESMKVDDGTLNISKYTGTQKKALENIVEEIQWMMRNEIIYSMTKTHTVNESVLKKVTEHITVSINKPGCAVQRFPLSFVLKPEKSLKSFIAQFEEIDLLQGYKILREGNYYYIVQEGGGDSMSCASSGSINNTMSCGNVLDEHQRFQLSPVKEVASIPNKRKHSENSHKPTCWLIVFIEDDIVSIYFQYREGQLSIVLPWRQALASLSANIKAICKSVNQEMLLIDLFESRLCHRLLESDKNEESSFNWNAHNYFSVQQQMQLQKQEMETNNSMANIDLRFKPGFFSCSIVWETYFCLHPRLKHFDHQLSRGIKAIKLKLSTFQVQNRHNIFVYMDENDNIYYITIREGSSTGCYEVEGDESRFISRTSSFSSCVAKNNGVSSTETMDNLSILSQSVDTPQFNSCTKINLKVQGLIEPGDDIKVHLVSTLEQELNEQVIEVISEVLQRNPRSKLSPMDVSFLQPSNNPDLTFSFYIPSNTSEKSVFSYLKQNLTHFQTKIPFIEPKYSSSKSEHHFRDQESSCTYIYTECGKIGRHKGIGVIKVEYHSEEFNESGIKSSDKGNNSSSEVFKSEDFVRFTNVSEEDSVDTNRSIIFSLWERGKLSVEKLKESLKQALTQSLWDYYMEMKICKSSILINDDNLSPNFIITKEWLDYGTTLCVPSVSKFVHKHSLHYSSFDLLKEIRKIIRLSTPDIICRMFHNSVEDGRGFICIRNEENVMTSQSDFYLIGQARKVEKNLDEEKELGTPNSDSYYRKFQSMPYSPRRDIIFIHVSRNEISFWVYNVSKDVVYQISKSVSSLSHWMSARSCLTTSIVSQKLGIFHNTKFNRKCQEQSDNPYLGSKGGIAYVELLVNNKAVPSKVSTSNAVESNKYQNNPKRINRFLSIYRDTKPSCLLSESPYANGNDPMKQHGSQMLHMKASDNKEMLSRLYFLWQNRGESSGNTIIFNNQVLKFFKKSARLVHFCLTPLLFLPHWRSQAHSTRLDIINPLDLSIHRRPQVEERSHIGLIQNYVQEYIQYLHTLGFIAIQRRVNNANSGNIYNHRKVGKRDLHQDSIKNVISGTRKRMDKVPSVYLQKSLPGGLLIFEIGVIQPFFFTKLYVMEYDRLICHYNFRRESNLVTGLGVTPEAIKESFTRKLIDECDNIKHLIHLHSFTYDYHLRTAHNFISGRPSNISKGFHLAFFIDDFLKYYNKGPNFARNMVHNGHIIINTPLVKPKKLYNYLLSHEKGYDLKVLRMEPLDAKANEDFECDYLLVRQSSSLTSQDQDTNGTSPSSSGSGSSMNIGNNLPGSFVSGYDDYDFVLLLINDDFHSSHENLNLKYYIILTSKRDLYPTYNVDKTKGQFRTVLKNECTKPLGAKKDDTASSIQRESVNYVGFYSSREQSMEKIMSSMILATETMVNDIFERAMVHCRRDQLWSRLLNPSSENGIVFVEFNELLTLVDIEPFEKINDELVAIVSRPLRWFKSLMKLMSTRYPVSRLFGAPDGSVQHLVIQDSIHKCVDSCILITMDTPNEETSLNLIFKEQSDIESVQNAVEDFVSICLYHIWSGIL